MWKKYVRQACLLGGLALIPAWLSVQAQASAPLPALGDGAEMSLSAERRLGDRIVRQLCRDPDYLDDPLLAEYVQSIWRRLVAGARARGDLLPELEERFAWDILLGRDRSVNAFALPGGYLGVHLGLIGAVSSADELASVLAHELSHVTQRHIARMIGRQEAQGPWVLAAMILGALAAGSNPQAAGAMIIGGQAAAIQGHLNFSRDMEREADRVGYGVMTQAGFAPQGFVSMFEKLQQAARLNDTGGFPYLRSHPLTTERIADMQARHQLLGVVTEPPMLLEHALLAARARTLSQPGVDALRARVHEALGPAGPSVDGPRRAGLLYAAALAAAELRDFAQAGRFAGQLALQVGREPAAARLARLLEVELALKQEQPQRALTLLAPLRPAPGAWRRPELFLYAQAWTRGGSPALAASPLQAWLAVQPRDAQAWQLLAAAYAAQGRMVSAVRAEAEAYAAWRDDPAALVRMQAAQELLRKPGAADHIEASIIDARVRELQTRTREQALER